MQLKGKGDLSDKMSVWIKTHDENDPEVAGIIVCICAFVVCIWLFLYIYIINMQEEYKRRLSEVPEDSQTIEVRDHIFHDMMGRDTHGYCRTYGRAIPRAVVYGKNSGLSQASSSSIGNVDISQIEERLTIQIEERLKTQMEQSLRTEIEQRLTGEIEQRVNAKFMELIKARMDLFEFQGGTNGCTQVVNGVYSDS